MRYVADFLLESDLCFSNGSKPFVMCGPGQNFSLTLFNAEKDPKFPTAVLCAHLVFNSEAAQEDLRDEAFAVLSEALNCLSYATMRKFVPVMLKKIIDWTPGLAQRRGILFHEQDEWFEPDPQLDSYIDSAERLCAMVSGPEQKSAMRWYRLAVKAKNPEEQFSYFWFALEIASEHMKGSEKVPTKCPKCQSALYCEVCQTHPLHRRYAGEAIRKMVETVRPKDGGEIFQTLQKIRHTLLHGGRTSDIQNELPADEQKIVTTLAAVTWHAIWRMFDKPDPRSDQQLQLGYVDNIVRRRMIVSADVSVKMPGDPNAPKMEDFPKINAEVTIMRRDAPAEKIDQITAPNDGRVN